MQPAGTAIRDGNRHWHSIAVIAFLGAIVVGLTGCGGGGGERRGVIPIDPQRPEIPIMPRDDHADSPAEATVLALGDSVPGAIEEGDDDDYFRVDVTEPGTLTVHTTGDLDTIGELQSGDGTALASANDTQIDTNFSIEHGVVAGTYFVRVASHGTATGSYVVHTRFVAGTGLPTDDHGNTRTDATPLALGSSFSGRIETDGDEDYFEVDVTESGTLTIYTTGSLDTVGELQQHDGTRLASDHDSGDRDNFRIELDVGIGTHYVKIGSEGMATGSYDVHGSFVADMPALPPDQSNTPAGSTELAPGETVIGYVHAQDDVDYFRLNVSEPSVLKLTLESDIPGLEISLRDENGNVLAAERTESPAIIILAVRVAVYRIVVSCSVNPVCVAAVKEALTALFAPEQSNAVTLLKFGIEVAKLIVEGEIGIRPDAPFVGNCRCVAVVEPDGDSKEIDFTDFFMTPSGNRPIVALIDQEDNSDALDVTLDRDTGRARISAPRGADLGVHEFTVSVSDSYTAEGREIPLPGGMELTARVEVFAKPRQLPGTSLELISEPGSRKTLALRDVIGPPDNIGSHPPILFVLDATSPATEIARRRLSARIERRPSDILVIEPPLDLTGEYGLVVSAWFPEEEYSQQLLVTAERSQQFLFDIVVGYAPRRIEGGPGLQVSLSAGNDITVRLTEYIEDPAGGRLTFSYDGSLPMGIDAVLNGSNWTITVPSDVEPGEFVIAVTATNSIGLSSDFTFQLTVEEGYEFGDDWQRAENVGCHAHIRSLEGLFPTWNSSSSFSYSGGCSAGKAHGLGTAVFTEHNQDGGGRFEGEWEDGWPAHGVRTGIDTGVRIFTGTRYEGGFHNGRYHGQGIWFGALWSNSCDLLCRLDGFRYEGEFRDGVFFGQGTVTHGDGTRYEGEWDSGHLVGWATVSWADGTRYEGDWVGGLLSGWLIDYGDYRAAWIGRSPHGQGTLTRPDGTSYVGSFVAGTLHGRGTLTGPGGTRYEGEWLSGRFWQGHGTGRYNFGSLGGYFNFNLRNECGVFDGEWRGGSPFEGQGTMVYGDGSGSIYKREVKTERGADRGRSTEIPGADNIWEVCASLYPNDA